jgi:signal transduction histidine kinase
MINIASEKLISLLIEDFLDLGQVRSGKFRRFDSNFAVSKPIEEVISILSFKAEHKMIQIETEY